MKQIDVPNVVQDVKNYLLSLQHAICEALSAEDGLASFELYPWKENIGSGIVRVISNGRVFEKGGVNFSHVSGDKLPASASQRHPELAGCRFQALGVSLVMHPQNPYVPISHANVRLFIAERENADPIWWFGGGFDLTPIYGFEEDCIHWHKTARNACDSYGLDVYPKLKKWCDDYFYLPHRKEPRGIGGLFYDDLNEWNFETCFSFMRSVGNHYLQAYRPIVAKRKNISFSKKEKDFQLYRRGRYVEFNLLYDRGTRFGIQSNGLTEAILMSLPPQAKWGYEWRPEKDSAEAKLYTDFLIGKNWVDLDLDQGYLLET